MQSSDGVEIQQSDAGRKLPLKAWQPPMRAGPSRDLGRAYADLGKGALGKTGRDIATD